ncbi:hypothetical protein MUN88_09980 [Gracilibacillus caseinilyticus]|uniref:Uncharacterized protein n=1 Tax=Gracilibacillus caseinilyticus TaxID=2932256 RepID=A0ABY4F2F0_9BACI|nr:hypothetical protein [Gracilibacillus caseinilyticus]UOQ50352.1 hypothetical protein MUN88_09980 [Gracilibacillus caseinilyticus]
MNITNITNEINYLKDILLKYEELEAERSNIFKKPLSNMSIGKKILLFIGMYMVSGFIYAIPNLKYLSIFVLLGSVYFIFFWPNRKVKSNIAQNKSRIEEIDTKILSLSQKIRPNYIPEKYIHLHALNSLESYFSNKRAASLKEALNLYEEEIRHMQHLKEMNMLQEMQNATYKKAQEATTIGWINMFRR